VKGNLERANKGGEKGQAEAQNAKDANFRRREEKKEKKKVGGG